MASYSCGPLFDQPHRLKLELPCKPSSLHDSPPVPAKHLTRCLRNRVQANTHTSSSGKIRRCCVDRLNPPAALLRIVLPNFRQQLMWTLQASETPLGAIN